MKKLNLTVQVMIQYYSVILMKFIDTIQYKKSQNLFKLKKNQRMVPIRFIMA